MKGHPPTLPGLLCGLLTLCACDATLFLDPEVRATEITVLFAYTPEAARTAGDIARRLDAAVAETNQAYRNSRVAVRLRQVHAVEVRYAMGERLQDLARLVSPADGYLDEVHALRDRYEADLCILVPDKPDATANAAILAEPRTAFAIVHVEHLGAPHFALAHEIGHLQGARHSPESDDRREPFPYGHGFRGRHWKTIMATGPLPNLPHFSNPGVRYEGQPTGTASLHDVARVINETAVYIANFRGPTRPTAFVPPGTWPVLSAQGQP